MRGMNLTTGNLENTCLHVTLSQTHTDSIYMNKSQGSAEVHKKRINCFFSCYKTPLFSLSHVGLGPGQSTWIVYTARLMKRYSADFDTFLLCSWKQGGTALNSQHQLQQQQQQQQPLIEMSEHVTWRRQYASIQLSISDITFCFITFGWSMS